MADNSGGSCRTVSLEDLLEWLRHGEEKPRRLVDLPWTIIEEKRVDGRLVSFRASHPGILVNMLVLYLPTRPEEGRGPFARLVLETDISTIDMEPGEKLSLYRRLLSVSRLPLVKYYIYGSDQNVGVAVDLDLKSLSIDEFEDALAMLLAGYIYLKKMKGFEEILRREEASVLAKLVIAHLARGESREEVIEYLAKSGITREEAEEIVSAVEEAAGGKTRSARREGEGGETLFI